MNNPLTGKFRRGRSPADPAADPHALAAVSITGQSSAQCATQAEDLLADQLLCAARLDNALSRIALYRLIGEGFAAGGRPAEALDAAHRLLAAEFAPDSLPGRSALLAAAAVKGRIAARHLRSGLREEGQALLTEAVALTQRLRSPDQAPAASSAEGLFQIASALLAEGQSTEARRLSRAAAEEIICVCAGTKTAGSDLQKTLAQLAAAGATAAALELAACACREGSLTEHFTPATYTDIAAAAFKVGDIGTGQKACRRALGYLKDEAEGASAGWVVLAERMAGVGQWELISAALGPVAGRLEQDAASELACLEIQAIISSGTDSGIPSCLERVPSPFRRVQALVEAGAALIKRDLTEAGRPYLERALEAVASLMREQDDPSVRDWGRGMLVQLGAAAELRRGVPELTTRISAMAELLPGQRLQLKAQSLAAACERGRSTSESDLLAGSGAGPDDLKNLTRPEEQALIAGNLALAQALGVSGHQTEAYRIFGDTVIMILDQQAPDPISTLSDLERVIAASIAAGCPQVVHRAAHAAQALIAGMDPPTADYARYSLGAALTHAAFALLDAVE